jgi:DNA-binding MarR family transcriptional regulator
VVKKKAAQKATPGKTTDRSNRLTPRGQQIISYLLNSIAFQTHSKDGDVESIAEHLGIAANRLRPTLKKMEDQGHLTVEGAADFVYPTVNTLRRQQPDLNVSQAEKLLRKVRRR